MHHIPRFRLARALQVLALLFMSHISQSAEVAEANSQLPDPFALGNGTRVSTPAQWRAHRATLKAQLARYEYGELPPAPHHARVIEKTATPEGEHRLLACGPNDALKFTLDLKFPAAKTGPFPVLICGDGLFKASAEPKAPAAAQVLERGYALAQSRRFCFRCLRARVKMRDALRVRAI